MGWPPLAETRFANAFPRQAPSQIRYGPYSRVYRLKQGCTQLRLPRGLPKGTGVPLCSTCQRDTNALYLSGEWGPVRGGLDAGLRAELAKVFALGFLDAMAGCPVKDDDLIAGVDAAAIETAALQCIAEGEEMLSIHYRENPQMCHDAVYDTGRWVYGEVERRHLQRN